MNFIITLNTAYYDSGVVEKRRMKIVSNYFKNQFLLESIAYSLLWFVPFEL